MIVVIADDFTGAAELAGIALQFGLSVELFTNDVKTSNADVVVVSTDSRSMNCASAIIKTKKIIEAVQQHNPSFIYKKIDSVLRGYVVEELKMQMHICNKNSALVIPANPSLGRTIKDGEYYINEKKIIETDFVNDPEFPITSSFVKEILNNEVQVLRSTDELPLSKICIGETSTTQEVNNWANKNLEDFVLAGAADFFTALLHKQFEQVVHKETILQTPFLYVCGSSFKTATDRINELKQNNLSIKKINNYFSLIKISIEKFALVIDEVENKITALQLRETMAVTTTKLIKELNFKELFIEGGSTAASILAKLNITKLQPINELSRGVVRMKAKELFITVKPGSYQVTDKIDKFLFNIKTNSE